MTTQYFVTPAEGYYRDRTTVISAHVTLDGARRAAGKGYVVRAGAKKRGDVWLRVYGDVYPIVG